MNCEAAITTMQLITFSSVTNIICWLFLIVVAFKVRRLAIDLRKSAKKLNRTQSEREKDGENSPETRTEA